jgi:hypothetical protein
MLIKFNLLNWNVVLYRGVNTNEELQVKYSSMNQRLFNDAVSTPAIIYRRIVWENCRIPRVWKDLEEVVVYFMALSQQWPGGSENYDQCQIIRCPVRDSKRPPLEYRLNQLYRLLTYKHHTVILVFAIPGFRLVAMRQVTPALESRMCPMFMSLTVRIVASI